MARIRIYQSFFNSPPLQRPDVRGVMLENKADVRQKLPSLDGVVNASGLYYVFPLARTQVLGAPLVASADVRLRRLSLNGAIIASGANGSELWKVPVTVATVVTSGWEFQQPPLVVRRRTADPESDDLSSDVIGSIAAPPQSGWSIVLPELRRVRPAAPLATLDSLSLPLGGDTDRPGWNVSLAELRQTKPRIGFADASVDSESWSPLQTVAAQPWGWSLPPPRPRAVHESVFAGATLDWTTQSVATGWTVTLPELAPFQPRAGVLAGADLAPQAINPSSYGWTVTTNDLPAFRRKQALPKFASRLDLPQAQPYGATVVLPDLPRLRHAHAPLELAQRLDPQVVVVVQQPIGWSVEPPFLRQVRPAKGGIFAGSFHEPPQIELSTAVVTAEQTYFIANVGRFMGRRG